MGKLRTRVGRAAVAREAWITGSLLLAATLLGGCNHPDTTGSAAAQATATSQTPAATQPVSVSTQGTSPGTQTSTPGPVTKATRNVEVSWSAPIRNTDGSALTDLAGYRVYYGTSPGSLSQSVDVPTAGAIAYVVQGLQTGTWYFAVAAYTNTGLESTRSSVVSKTIS